MINELDELNNSLSEDDEYPKWDYVSKMIKIASFKIAPK